MNPEWAERANDERYKRWLLDCVFVQGWTTYKCARELNMDPEDAAEDFARFVSELPKVKRGRVT